MSLHCLSFNHINVPIDIRERLFWNENRRESFLRAWISECRIDGAMMLSTCNRLEFYASGDNNAHLRTNEFIIAELRRLFATIGDLMQKFQEESCVRHLIRVACGLDSQSVGETQVLGQLKLAYQQASKNNALDPELHRLCQYVFHSAKHIRHELDLSRHPISIAGTAVQLMQRLFPQIHNKRILLVGAGATSRIVARHLHKMNFLEMRIANRSLPAAKTLALECGAKYCTLEQLGENLIWADIVFSCVDNRYALIGKGMIESAVRKRKREPQLLFDLGVPRNFEPEITQLDDVYLYNLDQIHEMSRHHIDLRLEKIASADRLVDHHVSEFECLSRLKVSDPVISQYRQSCSQGVEDLIASAHRKAQHQDLDTVLRWLAQRVQGKSMHLPTLLLKQIALEDETLMRKLTASVNDLNSEEDESIDA